MVLDPLTIGMLVILAVLVFFMFRNSRKRQKDAAELQNKVAVGAEVMTNYGLFGKILSIDDEDNQVLLETTPGTILRVHRQTITRVVSDETEELSVAALEADDAARNDDAVESSDESTSLDSTDKPGDK